HNFNRFPLTLAVALHFDADFADIFEVRGIARHVREPRRCLPVRDGVLRFAREGCDGLSRTTAVRFDPTPNAILEGTASYELELPPGSAQRIAITIRVATEPVESASSTAGSSAVNAPSIAREPPAARRPWLGDVPLVESSSGLFNAILAQSRADL